MDASGYIYAKSLTTQNNLYDGAYLHSNSGTVTVTGRNYFRDNGYYGLCVLANGNVSVGNAVVWSNGWEGVLVEAGTGNIVVYNITAAHNKGTGVLLDSDGTFFTVINVTAFLNGQDDLGNLIDDGLAIYTDNAASLIIIINSTFMTNWWGSGIEIDHPYGYNPALFWPTLINVSYLSNGGPNLYVHS